MEYYASRTSAAAEERVLRGASLYHTRTEEVLWVTEMLDETVQLTARTDTFEMNRDALIEQINQGDIVIETQPLPVPKR